MVNGSQFSLSLPPDLDEEIHRVVQSGEYATESEVVLEALTEWTLRRAASGAIRARLQELWAEGLASGTGQFGSMEAIKQEARRRLGEGTKKPG